MPACEIIRICLMSTLRWGAMAVAGCVLAAPLAARAAAPPLLHDLGLAPEFAGLAGWLGSPPLTMAGLRGKVVLVDFWAYSCINCLRTVPFLTRWQHEYGPAGLVVVGVHAPEFKFERSAANVQSAMRRFGIDYPVAQDNDLATWKAFHNEFWPAEYVINQKGRIVYTHSGEGNYDVTENIIRTLLKTGGAVGPEPGTDLTRIGSPEMYFGLDRVENLASPEKPSAGAHRYTAPASLALNRFALVGTWSLSGEKARLVKAGGEIHLHCHAGKVFMVASASRPVTLQVSVDGKAVPAVQVGESRLYTLLDGGEYSDHDVVVTIAQPGLEAFTFTFG